MTLRVSPSSVFFSQDSISEWFSCGRHIADTLADLVHGAIAVTSIPPLTVFSQSGKLWVRHGNRRLWIYRRLHDLGFCNEIRVSVTKTACPARRFTTSNGGASVQVRRWSYVDDASTKSVRWKVVRRPDSSDASAADACERREESFAGMMDWLCDGSWRDEKGSYYELRCDGFVKTTRPCGKIIRTASLVHVACDGIRWGKMATASQFRLQKLTASSLRWICFRNGRRYARGDFQWVRECEEDDADEPPEHDPLPQQSGGHEVVVAETLASALASCMEDLQSDVSEYLCTRLASLETEWNHAVDATVSREGRRDLMFSGSVETCDDVVDVHLVKSFFSAHLCDLWLAADEHVRTRMAEEEVKWDRSVEAVIAAMEEAEETLQSSALDILSSWNRT
eukprot:TRINITY_DN55187_c0_g1_i1.p1 TRINITY_DN55187_c0_g1~~TRINITY_DN55187_c0_g1_i1.p1  ORF type:complete len:395 (+),score=54.70 TRINITY_DN55187_c0_g1_i1:22-1206(+)